MIASLILFPPWAAQLLQFYHNPLIVDATFTCENLRFISGVIVDGEWNTQAIGLIIRGTEDTQGYAHLFNFVSKVIGDEHITIIADMAKCIQKAAKESFNHYSFVFCYFHLKQNYLKNIKFTPSEDLWYSLQLFMKGEISYEEFQNNWIKEESYVDIETKGFTYLCKYAHYFTPKPMTHKRGIISSQRIENLNGLMKKHGNSALEMLRQFVAISTCWFEKGSTVTYPHDRFLTYYADDILNKVIQSEFKSTKFDEILHFPLNETECGCGLCRDMGIPCPFTIRLLRIKQSHSGNDGTDPMNSSLFNNESLLKLISPEWLVSTHQKAFEPLIERKNDTFHVLPLDEIKDGFNSQHLDIISAKIRWLYQNSPKYKANVDDLLSKAQEEIVFPFFNIKKTKNSEKKRHLSSIEINQKKKTNDEKRDILLKHLDGNKITKASLLALADHLTCTNNDLPKVNKSISKEKLLEWFDANWKIISPMLGVLYINEEKEGLRQRDVQTDGYYNYSENHFTEIFYSPTNGEILQGSKYKNYYVDLSISFRVRPKDDLSPYRRYDFNDVFNIGYEDFNNNPWDYMDPEKPVKDKDGNIIRYEGKWMREIKFKNVWDRHSCSIYSSLAEQSNKYYLGNSQIDFYPIKYFKLNSTDQRFWVEFNSGRHNNIPVLVPNNESFVIEMQLLPFKKMLYI
ncbi:hypothetical protein M9Y10_031268 [Tritrichomonas musculus]|uniref:MULE transposase domain-containing protein n=1 Tax=Tritrichomonas musculus TaxID=1915356 RepID=A0ABR2H1A1_9EUKA